MFCHSNFGPVLMGPAVRGREGDNFYGSLKALSESPSWVALRNKMNFNGDEPMMLCDNSAIVGAKGGLGF